MNIEARKISLINWISAVQDEETLDKLENLQKEKTDWYDSLNEEDKKAIEEGIKQLDNNIFLTHNQVRSKIREKFNF